jgi:hypothetical protein
LVPATFALYEKPDEIAELIDDFLGRTRGRPAAIKQQSRRFKLKVVEATFHKIERCFCVDRHERRARDDLKLVLGWEKRPWQRYISRISGRAIGSTARA